MLNSSRFCAYLRDTQLICTILFNRLALCEKALAEYLETKRLAFPRFYFISSADLLDILSKGSRPREVHLSGMLTNFCSFDEVSLFLHSCKKLCLLQVTCHLSKLFDNMSALEFASDEQVDTFSKTAVGMYSKEKEYVPFQSGCSCTGPVR